MSLYQSYVKAGVNPADALVCTEAVNRQKSTGAAVVVVETDEQLAAINRSNATVAKSGVPTKAIEVLTH
jgi:hypothetical protein